MDLFGSNDSVTAGAGSNFGVRGSNDTITTQGSGDGIWLGGNGATGGDDFVVMARGIACFSQSNSRMDLFGSNDSVTAGAGSNFGVYGSNDTITTQGSGDGIWLGGNGATGGDDFVYGSGDSVFLQSNSRMDLFGSNDSVTAGAGSNFGVYGSNDTITTQGSGDGIWLGGNGATGGDDFVYGSGIACFFSPTRAWTSSARTTA